MKHPNFYYVEYGVRGRSIPNDFGVRSRDERDVAPWEGGMQDQWLDDEVGQWLEEEEVEDQLSFEFMRILERKMKGYKEIL